MPEDNVPLRIFMPEAQDMGRKIDHAGSTPSRNEWYLLQCQLNSFLPDFELYLLFNSKYDRKAFDIGNQ
jgi:hypothetical protein